MNRFMKGGIYIGLYIAAIVCSNFAMHSANCEKGKEEGNKQHYSVEVRKKWKQYSQDENSKMSWTNLNLLIPLSAWDPDSRPYEHVSKNPEPLERIVEVKNA